MGCSALMAFGAEKSPNLDKDKTLYLVGYAHLDTQWRWDYRTTIDEYILNTLDDNFELFEKYPEYNFNFTGAARYDMMKEYYPERYEKLKDYIKQGRWFVSGSSVDECDALIPSPESILRQVLYGNKFFRNEFGKESKDFILPDCFGFPSYLPSLWNHCGLLGFSTQKLYWGSIVGVPFNVGMWEGPDGESVVCALNPESYGSGFGGNRPDLDEKWINRLQEDGEKYGVFADYRYFGVGDVGGAPHERDVKTAVECFSDDEGKIDVILGSSFQLYEDLTEAQKSRLPKYKGELMLTEHSSGVMTSQAFMKRLNRKNEQLADAAERAAVIADWLGAAEYPAERLEKSWWRFLQNQMHDILPGTTIPVGYQFSWNDEIISLNGFADVLTNSVAAAGRALDTNVRGEPIVVYNPLSISREDIVTARIELPANSYPRVYNAKGKEVPSQVVSRDGETAEIIFLADVPAVSVSAFELRSSDRAFAGKTGLELAGNTLENEYYSVVIDEAGDIENIFDKKAGKQLFSRPARLEFHRGTPEQWPAWNMDWNDRKHGPIGYVDGEATIKVVENGPVRIALEITREARNSIITQKISLSAGDCGKRVELYNNVDWQSSATVLKASFPLTVSNKLATYTQGLGTIQRGNNYEKQFEMLSHEWFDLTDTDGSYGVSILEDCKFGSDKPSNNVIRLSLLYTPGGKVGSYMDQHTQDWGHQEFSYGIYGHKGNWQDALTEYQGRRFNQPLRAFSATKHKGSAGRELSMLKVNTEQVDVRAIKLSEDGSSVIIRLQELLGKNADGVTVSLGNGIESAVEVNGQEQVIGDAIVSGGKLKLDMSKSQLRSFAVKLKAPRKALDTARYAAVDLPYNIDAFSSNSEKSDGPFSGASMPAEQVPSEITLNGVSFDIKAEKAKNNAVACAGQTISLPAGDYNRLYIIAAADEDVDSTIKIGAKQVPFAVQNWTGFIGSHDVRAWDRPFKAVDYQTVGLIADIDKGFIKRDNVAWYATHHHDAEGNNATYLFSYMFEYGFDLNGAKTITLPVDSKIKIFAVSVAEDENVASPLMDLYDNFDNRKDIELREKPGNITDGKTAAGLVSIEKAESYEELRLRKPVADDFADAATGNNVEFAFLSRGLAVKPRAGEVDGKLPALTDGIVSELPDEPSKAVYFDNGQGRFFTDFGKLVDIEEVNTFSRHKSDRAPQKYTLWAAAGDANPAAELSAEDAGGWTLIASVDTNELGEGGAHLSSVSFPRGSKFKKIMFVTDLEGQGTFFNEIDIIAR